MKRTVTSTLGNGLGNILANIAQTKLVEGNPEEALNVYYQSLPGITEEFIINLLKGDAVLYTSSDTELSYTDEEDKKQEMIELGLYYQDWNCWLSNRIDDFKNYRDAIFKHRRECIYDCSETVYNLNLSTFDMYPDLDEELKDSGADKAMNNLCARAISGKPWSKQTSGGEDIWEKFIYNIEDDLAEEVHVPKEKLAIYHVYVYVKLIRMLYNEFNKFYKTYEFLIKHSFITKPEQYEDLMESIFSVLLEFAENADYSHPMCNDEINELKKNVLEAVRSYYLGETYYNDRILCKDIADGYDAGYLAPDGTFYGANGADSAMLHLNIADTLFKHKMKDEMAAAGVKENSSNNPEHYLEYAGYIKIHREQVYGFFRFNKEKESDDEKSLWCPTPQQVTAICTYIDKWYDGKFFTLNKSLGEISIYKLKQMDEYMLHETFEI